MKKIKYLPYILACVFLLASCSDDDDNVFGTSAAERLTAAGKEYREVLSSAPNGWVLKYYYDTEPAKIGGYTFLCAFDTMGYVTMAHEKEITDVYGKTYKPKDKVKSAYTLAADQGIVLSFNSYNSLLHYYAEPKNSMDPDGFKGDYEFVMQEVTPERIVMEGKKHGNRIVMTPLPKDRDWDEYIDGVCAMAKNNFYPEYELLINKTPVDTLQGDYYTNRFTFNLDSAFVQNIAYTPEGFTFYKPVTVNGVTFENFKWDAAQKSFVSTDEGADVVFKGTYPDTYRDYDYFLGTYKCTYNNYENRQFKPKITIMPNEEGVSYIAKGFTTGEESGDSFVADYDYNTGLIAIVAPRATNGDIGFRLMNWMGGNVVNSNSFLKYLGYPKEENGTTVLTFRSNMPTTGHIGFTYVFNQGGSDVMLNQFTMKDVVLTKIKE